jgi:glutamate-1-semialdehyde 2,1-aminomutase
VPANMGVVPPANGFLERLRALADESGALLILDEVISGFRVSRGGAQQLYGVSADLTVMGKIVGGGLPAAAYGGRRELMEQIAPAGDVYQAGTLSGNPLAVAAGLATLRRLDAAAYERLGELTDRMVAGMREAAGDRPVQVQSVPGLFTVFFSKKEVKNFKGASAADSEAYARFCRAMLDRGVYPPASQFEAWFVSLAHTDEAIAKTLEAAKESIAEALA